MEDWVRHNWTGLQGGSLDITPLAKGQFGYQFNCREDVDHILRKVWTYGKTPFQLKIWTPPFNVDTKRLDTIPVWVRLPGLPWELWNLDSLGDIGNALGTFIEVDISYQQTKIRKVARILVLLNIITSLREYLNLTCQTKTKKTTTRLRGTPISLPQMS